MPGRSFNSNQFRYGYQGSEKDDEITGVSGANISTFFRELDTRLGRWWAVDPKVQAGESPYVSMGNNPIAYNDTKGDVIDLGKTRGERFENRIRGWVGRNFGKGHNEFAKQWDIWETKKAADGKDIVYQLEQTFNNNALRNIRDGDDEVKKDPEIENFYHVFFSQSGEPDDCKDGHCIPGSAPFLFSNDKKKQNHTLPYSETMTLTISTGTTIIPDHFGHKDKLQIYSGGHKIYDKTFRKGGDGTIELDDFFFKGEIKCKTIVIRVTSGWDTPTRWDELINIPGDCD